MSFVKVYSPVQHPRGAVHSFLPLPSRFLSSIPHPSSIENPQAFPPRLSFPSLSQLGFTFILYRISVTPRVTDARVSRARTLRIFFVR